MLAKFYLIGELVDLANAASDEVRLSVHCIGITAALAVPIEQLLFTSDAFHGQTLRCWDAKWELLTEEGVDVFNVFDVCFVGGEFLI